MIFQPLRAPPRADAWRGIHAHLAPQNCKALIICMNFKKFFLSAGVPSLPFSFSRTFAAHSPESTTLPTPTLPTPTPSTPTTLLQTSHPYPPQRAGKRSTVSETRQVPEPEKKPDS